MSVVISTRSPRRARALTSFKSAGTCPRAGSIRTTGSISPVGRMTCSTTSPPVIAISYSLGVAETNNRRSNFFSHSSNRSGRLSMALGRRNPCSTSVLLRLKSPANIPRICGTVTCDSSRISRLSCGKKSRRVVGVSPGCAPRDGASNSRSPSSIPPP